MIRTSDIYNQGKRVAYRVIGGQAVLVKPADDIMLTLNETGTAIWNTLTGCTVTEIAESIKDEFEVDTETALADTIEFIGVLKERGLVELSDSASGE